MGYRSCPVHVDARKRCKGERANAADGDVRLLQRHQAGLTVHGGQKQAAGAKAPASAAPASASAPAPASASWPWPSASNPISGLLDRWCGGMQATSPLSTPSFPRVQESTMHTVQGVSTFQSADDAIFEINFESAVLSVISPSAFGYSAQELVGQPLLAITPPRQHSQLLHALQTMLQLENMLAMMSSPSTNTESAANYSIRVIHHVIAGLGSLSRRTELVAVNSLITLIREPNCTAKLRVRSRRAVGAENIGGFQMLNADGTTRMM